MEGQGEKTRFNQRIQEGGLIKRLIKLVWSYKGQDPMIHSPKKKKKKTKKEKKKKKRRERGEGDMMDKVK